MSYWRRAVKRERAGELKWALPSKVAGCYVIEVASQGRSETRSNIASLFYVGSSCNMQANRFYQHHRWMKKHEVLSVRWKSSRRRGDWAMEEVRLIHFFKERDRLLNGKWMKTDMEAGAKVIENVRYVEKTSKIFGAGEAALAEVKDDISTVADELIALLEKEK